MFDGVIGKIIMFWIFMLGAAFFAKILGFTGDTKTAVMYFAACAIVFIVWTLARTMAKKKRGN